MTRGPIRGGDWRHQGTALFAERFLVRPAARPDESFLGYRLRVAFANGLSNPAWLDCVTRDLPKAHGIVRWCPRCLGETNCYWREGWHSGPGGCFEHRCWLTSSCNNCHRILRWMRVRFANCTCGASLANAPVATFSTELQHLVSERSASGIGTLSVGERWYLARFLGALSAFGLQDRPLKKVSRRSESVEQLVVTAGASLIADRSMCFELLDRLRVPQRCADNVPLLSELFPGLLTRMQKHLNEIERRWILDLLGAYVEYCSRRGSAVLWERKGLNVRADNESLGRHKTRNPAIAIMLARVGVTVPIRHTRTGRQKFLIDEADLDGLRSAQRQFVPTKTAARYAGLSTRRIQALAKSGVLASTGARIDMKSVNRLLGDIVAACGRDAPAPEEPISLADALRLYVRVEASTTFFNRLVSGALGLVVDSSKRPTTQTIFVDRGEAIAVAHVPVESDSQISIVEAARRLCVKQEVMYHLINIGLVGTRTGKPGRRAARVVEVNELNKFAEQFLPLITLARASGISAREAPDWAKQRGVEIVTGPSVDGGRQYWVRRPNNQKVL